MHVLLTSVVASITMTLGNTGAEPASASAAKVERPGAADYQKAEWPRPNGRLGTGASFQGRELPRAEDIFEWTWVTPRPDLRGRVVVLDFWATWCPPCRRASPILDEIQKANTNDLAIVAVGGQRENEQTIRSYVEKHPVAYHHAFDGTQRMIRELRVTGIPHVVVVSSDGVVRWQGNPLDDKFRTAVEKTLDADPYVAARRQARGASEAAVETAEETDDS
ncbi:MAG: TlpA disulfide reductase family protein [Planctomycetota bacterium]